MSMVAAIKKGQNCQQGLNLSNAGDESIIRPKFVQDQTLGNREVEPVIK